MSGLGTPSLRGHHWPVLRRRCRYLGIPRSCRPQFTSAIFFFSFIISYLQTSASEKLDTKACYTQTEKDNRRPRRDQTPSGVFLLHRNWNRKGVKYPSPCPAFS
jgi:hypothetical protein